jgi:short-subunit dehydrogenase
VEISAGKRKLHVDDVEERMAAVFRSFADRWASTQGGGRLLRPPSDRIWTPPEGEARDMPSTDTRPLAVVTGASSGIGLELARQFAGNGFDLIVSAEDADLEIAAAELRGRGARIDAARLDLTTDEGVDALYERIKQTGRPVAALALNAGIGAGGSFAGPDGDRTDLAQELAIIDLNVRSTVHLAKHVVGDMVARDEGRVLFTSSIASTMPGSFQAVYNASKSFVQSFALALRNELKDTSVTVTSLMPGPTETEFFERADMLDTKVGASGKDDPADVARDGFEAMMAGKERVVSASLSTKAQARGSRLLPDGVKAELHRKMAEPGSGDDS